MTGDGVKVDLGELSSFARAAAATADAHLSSGPDRAALLSAQSSQIAIVPNTFVEGSQFTRRHTAVARAALAFMKDAVQGVASLGAAAQSCADGYASADDLSAALTRAQAIDAQHPYEALMGGRISGSAAISEGDMLRAFAPGTGQRVASTSGNVTPGGGSAAPDIENSPAARNLRLQEQLEQNVTPVVTAVGGAGADIDQGAATTLAVGSQRITIPADVDHNTLHRQIDEPAEHPDAPDVQVWL